MASHSLLLHNAIVVTPDHAETGSVFCRDGQIISVHQPPNPLPDATEVIDAAGRYLFPGFIDIHSHGANGFNTCDAKPESIREIAKVKLAEGVTTWLPTTMTLPQSRLKEIATSVAAYLGNPADGARVPGLHLEGPFLNPDFIGAQNPDHVAPPDPALVDAIAAICPVLILSLAVEIPGAVDVIRSCKAKNIVTSCAHSAASYADFRNAKQAGLIHLTHFCNQMSPLHHREIGLVGAGLLDPDIQLELICDGLHVSEPMLELIFSTVGAERLMLITDSIEASWLGDGRYHLAGKEIEVRDGAAHIADTDTLAGTTLKFNDALARAARVSGYPLCDLAKIAAENQARSCGLKMTGAIQPGYAADFALLDSDFSVWKTIVGGEVRHTRDGGAIS